MLCSASVRVFVLSFRKTVCMVCWYMTVCASFSYGCLKTQVAEFLSNWFGFAVYLRIPLRSVFRDGNSSSSSPLSLSLCLSLSPSLLLLLLLSLCLSVSLCLPLSFFFFSSSSSSSFFFSEIHVASREKVASATVSPYLYETYWRTYKSSVTHHSGSCIPTSGISVLECVMW